MRKIVVVSMITLDGVLQGPGGPEEDTSGGFNFGGWVAPYGDEASGSVFQELMQPVDLLLGRKTFEIWEHYWPQHAHLWPGINEVTKYVVSTTRMTSDWKPSVFLNSLEAIQTLKQSNGSDIKVWGSGDLMQTLLRNDLVDELWLLSYPLTLGRGKRLFADGSIPTAFTLRENTVTPNGVIMAHYERAGEVKTGRIGA